MSITMDDLSILLVEPSNAQQMILREHFEQVGARDLRFAHTIEEAMIACRAVPPHLVLSAMHLPDGKGSDLLARLRADEELDELAFILVSSETRAAELEPIRQGGAVAIVRKPCTRQDILQALSDTLDLLTRESLELESEDVEDLRALVVDDSKTARRFILKVLGQLGLESIEEAEDGQDAAERMAERFFDIVFTDYNMPRMNGHELLEHIRTDSNQPSVPVVMITSETNGARIQGVERAGVSAIVDKPFEIDRVRRILYEVLG